MAQQMEGVDERLWIRTSGCDSRDFLVGNSHTFPGRMSAYCPTDGVHYSVSLSEIEDMSPDAVHWVAGFLVGNQPRPEDLFGPGIHDAHDSDPHWRRWTEAVEQFRRTGTWPHAGWSYLIPFPPGTTLPPFVWTHRGDEVWTWHGDAWVRADPQPAFRSGLLEGTVCFQRGHCGMTLVTTAHSVCDDCGATVGTVPDGLTREEWEAAQYTYEPTSL